MHFNQCALALAFAAAQHRDQRRRDAAATPYINHPIAVAAVLAEAGEVDTLTLCAAYLHDTLEDTQATPEVLTALFGGEVAALVVELSDAPGLQGAERRAAQQARAPKLSARAKRVKLADKICNVADVLDTPPVQWSLQQCRDYVDWAALVVQALGQVDAVLEARFAQLLARRTDL